MAKPPSRVRYEKSHPVISFRVSQEEHDQFKDLLAKKGQSQRDFFKEAIGIQEPKYEKAYNNGFEEAKKKYVVRFRCSVCNEWTEIISDEGKECARKAMESGGWGHAKCIDKRIEQREEAKRKKAKERKEHIEELMRIAG